MTALEDTHRVLEAQAPCTVPREVKAQARVYIAYPFQLDKLRFGFTASLFTPEQLIEFGRECLLQECSRQSAFFQRPRYARLLDFTSKINVKAAILVGRWQRRKER